MRRLRYHSVIGVVVSRTVYKPAGIPVFPPHDHPDGDCLLKRLLARGEIEARSDWPDGFAGGIAHRLDISTSGAMLVADDLAELALIRELFSAKCFTKTYRLRVAKSVSWDNNQCDRAIAHDRRRRAKMIVQRGENTPHRGKWLPAQTQFQRVHHDLFEAQMHTGVMHQIRVHAAFLGIPLLGDRLYGGGSTPPDAGPGVTFFLHHVGLTSKEVSTAAVPMPSWAMETR